MPNINPAMLVMQALGAGQPLNNILGNLAGQGAQYAKAVELIKGKDAQITAQAQKIFGLELAASQQAQNQYLVSQLGYKAPVPAFNVPTPWQYGNYSCNSGCNSGCSGCGNY